MTNTKLLQLFLVTLCLFVFSSARPLRAGIIFVNEIPADSKAGKPRPETDIVIHNTATGGDKIITTRKPGSTLFSLNVHPDISADGRKIAYSSYRIYFDENLKIWKDWNGDPCTIAYGRPLTEDDYVYGYAYYPSRQYYASMLSHNWNVFVYDVKTGKEKQVTFFKWDEGEPHFIGRGSAVMYSLVAQKSAFILKTSGDKRGFKQIILQNNEAIQPSVSNDGRYMVFQSFLDGNWELYTLRLAENRKDKIKTRLTRTSETTELFPKWSQDGKSVLFASNKDTKSFYDLYTINIASGKQTRITRDGRVGGDAAFSPDGKKIAYTSFSAKHGPEIYVINADGTGKKLVTGEKGASRLPAWSPDGKKLAFINDSDGTPGLYTVNADGTGMARASKLQAAWDAPKWY